MLFAKWLKIVTSVSDKTNHYQNLAKFSSLFIVIFFLFMKVINMEDSDDELPTLSADTFAALQQFYKEEVSFDKNLF